MTMDYMEIKDAMSIKSGHLLEIGEVNEEGDEVLVLWRVDATMRAQTFFRVTEKKGRGFHLTKARVATVDLAEATMRVAGAHPAPLRLLGVL